MWHFNFIQNTPTAADDARQEAERRITFKDQVEKCLDLTNYLKYLDQLFNQSTSESESSDSDDGGTSPSRVSNDLHSTTQSFARTESQFSHLEMVSSALSNSNHTNTLSALNSFNFITNVSAAPLVSITPSLQASSSENGTGNKLTKKNDTLVKLASNNPCVDVSNGSTSGSTGSEKSDENEKKDKKPQKKKKGSKSNSESLSRQHKPSSGGNGNGSRGAGGGGNSSSSSGGGSSNGANSGSSSASNKTSRGSGSGSHVAKYRTIKQNLQHQPIPISEAFCLMENESVAANANSYTQPSFKSSQTVIENQDILLSNSDMSDTFANELLSGNTESTDAFDSTEMDPFSLNSFLGIQEDEGTLIDYISMTTPIPTNNVASSSSQSDNLLSKLAAPVSSSVFANIPKTGSGFESHNSPKGKNKAAGKKAKADGETPEKLIENQKQTRIEMLNAKRRKIYVYIARKEIGKTQRNRTNSLKESIIMKKKLAHICARHLKKKAIQSDKCMKESVCKAKKLTQEMEMYWKHVERTERELLRKEEREVEEKLKYNLEVLNKTLQDQKMNQLLTQIEQFTAKLLNKAGSKSTELVIVDKINKIGGENFPHLGEHESEKINLTTQSNVDHALQEHHNLVKLLDLSGLYQPGKGFQYEMGQNEISQPYIFDGVLKKYQIKGMNWLKQLYELGLNGIFADEAGLGKKIQVIAFLTYLAETCGLWGPFLVVVPTHSLQKWQQEFNRMSPRLKVVPYLGKPAQRKILRQFLERNSFHKEDTSFHVVVTSYQIMASDLKYFSKVKWQYLAMDDSQGIVTSSTKWISLLSFRCRNKLLISNNPQLNASSHLCAYLYFVVPSLFDSQVEYSEWLLKELEPSPRNSYELNACMIARLQAAVKKFLLRRVKVDVENEMSHNIDIQLYCSLSQRQQQIHNDLLRMTDFEEVLRDIDICQPQEIRNRLKNVLNLSIQLRKTCNHPSLVQKLESVTPFWMESNLYPVPKLIYQNPAILGKQKFVETFSIYEACNVHDKTFHNVTNNISGTWSFARILDLSCGEVQQTFLEGITARLIHLVNFLSVLDKIIYNINWNEDAKYNLIDYPSIRLWHVLNRNKVLSKLVFTSISSPIYTWDDCTFYSTPETIEHRTLRSRKTFPALENPPMLPEIKHIRRMPCIRSFQPLEYPKFLFCYSPKAFSAGVKPYIQAKYQTSYPGNLYLYSDYIHPTTSDPCTSRFKTMIWKSALAYKWSQITLPNKERIVSESGKLKVLDGLLANLKRNGNKVLICAYFAEVLEILEEFLNLRRWKYTKLENNGNNKTKSDVFVYLLPAHQSFPTKPKISVDTVIFYDQDWDTKIEDQKTKIINKLVHPSQISCYRLICNGTIEEAILRLNKERHIVSLALCKDILENQNVSAVPSLKSLVSVLVSEYSIVNGLKTERRTNQKGRASDVLQTKSGKRFDIDAKAISSYTKRNNNDGDMGYAQMRRIGDYVGGSDSASPSCSEELDTGEIEVEMKINKYQAVDNFSFDEGYMGMSPDSYEDAVIKSDYEEDSSPKKPRLGRGTGKRGRPPSKARFQNRNLGERDQRRGPGRPRLKPIGPANHSVRGRRPGRPPLTKKAETISSTLTPLASGQRVFGFYSSPDLELS